MFLNYFATPIYQTSLWLSDDEISTMKQLLSTRLHLVSGNNNLYTGDLNLRENDSQILALPEFDFLRQQIQQHARVYLSHITEEANSYKQCITKSWPVIVEKNGIVSGHIHSDSHLSAVYYLEDPEPNSDGELILIRDEDNCMYKMGVIVDYLNTEVSGRYVSIAPEKNKLVIFPSCTKHTVTPHLGDKPRYSISCDILNVKKRGNLENSLTPPDTWIIM